MRKRNNRGNTNVVSIVVIILIVVLVLIIIAVFSIRQIVKVGTMPSKQYSMTGLSVDESMYDTEVSAVIVENLTMSSSVGEGVVTNSGDAFLPVYQYEYNGEKYQTSGSVASSQPHYEIGDTVTIRINSSDPTKMYDPQFNPETVFAEFGKDSFGILLRFAICGVVAFLLVFAGVVAFLIWIYKKNLPQRQANNMD